MAILAACEIDNVFEAHLVFGYTFELMVESGGFTDSETIVILENNDTGKTGAYAEI